MEKDTHFSFRVLGHNGVDFNYVAGFVSRDDTLTFVKAAHFPRDYGILDAISGDAIFDTRGMTHVAVTGYHFLAASRQVG